MVTSFETKDLDKSRKIYFDLLPVFTLAFCETNPIPIKAAMNWMGYSENLLRLPLTPLSNSLASDDLKKHVFRLRDKGYE